MGGGRIWLTVCLKWDANLNLKHISYGWIILKSVARGKRGTHDTLQAQWPGNEVAKAHCQLWSVKIWIDKLFPNGSCKILLCVCLETMEIQLEQSLLFESDEILFLSVKSKGHICISKECEVFIGKPIPTMRLQAILLFCFHGEIDGRTLLICCILVLTQIKNPTF